MDFQTNQTDSGMESYDNIKQFGYELFKQGVHEKNPVLSPISAYLMLAMAGCGADGTTRDEFYRVLGPEMVEQSGDMMRIFHKQGTLLTVSIANAAWAGAGFTLKDGWLDTIKSKMDAEAYQADLGSVTTMNTVNQWVSDKTNGMINKMFTEPLGEQPGLALVNTVYFKGRWKIPFEPYDTHREVFYLNKAQNITVQTDMMRMKDYEGEYISDDFTEGVILPYDSNHFLAILKNEPRYLLYEELERENIDWEQPITDTLGELAFVALKPKANRNTGNIRELCSRLSGRTIKEILASKQDVKMDLKLPKYAITFDRILNQSLTNMGLTECFDASRADFRLIGSGQNGENMHIGIVKQKAKIFVDEKGTEASASDWLGCLGIIHVEKELYFNEPFLYMIIDKETEVPLFVGILDNPVL